MRPTPLSVARGAASYTPIAPGKSMPTLAKRYVQNTPVDNIHFAVAMLRWTLQIECTDCEELVKRLNALEKAAIAKAMK